MIRLFLAISGFLAAAIVTWLVGAHGLGVVEASPQIGAAVALGVGGVACLALPLFVAFRLLRALPKANRPTVTLATVWAWNTALAAAVLVGLPTATASAVRSHGDWFLVGREVPQVQAALQPLADLIERTARVEPLPVDADNAVERPIEPAGDTQLLNEPWTPKRIFSERADSVVVIRVWEDVDDTGMFAKMFRQLGVDQAESQGSGFVIAPGLVVTNHHVIDGADRAEIVLRDGRRLAPIEVLVLDADHDLALLRIPEVTLPAVPLAERVPDVGEACYAIGAPLGMSFTFTEGIVSARRAFGGVDALQMQTPIAPGSSGGPLFDGQGQLVGINTATMGAGLNLAVEAKYANALLDAPQSGRILGVPLETPALVKLEVDGPLEPVMREQIGEVAPVLARLAESCLEGLPPGAEATIELAASTVSSNLGQPTEACFAKAFGRGMSGTLLVPALRAAVGEEVRSIALTFDGISAKGASEADSRPRTERTLTLRLVLHAP